MLATEAVRFILLFLFVVQSIVAAPAAIKEKRSVEQPPDVAIKAAHKEAAEKKAEKKSNNDENANVHVEIKSLPTDAPGTRNDDSSEASREKEIIEKIEAASADDTNNDKSNEEKEDEVVNGEQGIFQEGMINKLLNQESEKQLTELVKNDDASNEDSTEDESDEKSGGKVSALEEKVKAIKNAMSGKDGEDDDVSEEIEKLIADSKLDGSDESDDNIVPYVDDSEWYLPLLEEAENKDTKQYEPYYASGYDQRYPFSRRRRQVNNVSIRQKRATFATEAGMLAPASKHSVRSKRDVPFSDEDIERVREWLRENASPDYSDEAPDYSEPADGYFEGEDSAEGPYPIATDYNDEDENSEEEQLTPEVEYELEREMGLIPEADDSSSSEEDDDDDEDDDIDIELDEPNARPLLYNGQPGIFVPIKKRQMLSTMPGFRKRRGSFYPEPDAQEGRWRAFTPQAAEKRGVMEEYTRLYRLARALHRPQEEQEGYFDGMVDPYKK
ncbi:uncharacterized protein LOC141908374 isoform X2 [Tubulanus polymorphus]